MIKCSFYKGVGVALLSVWSLVPALVAIILAYKTKRVLLALFVGTLLSVLLLNRATPLEAPNALLELYMVQFKEAWIVYSLLFALLVGAIIRLLEYSGGVEAFVFYLGEKKSVVRSKRAALFLGMLTGFIIFIESSITTLIVATVTKPFAKKYQISKEKIAYVCDTTSAPVCTMIPINGWGALLLGLLASGIATQHLEDTTAVGLLFESIGFNFYAIVSLLFLAYIIYTDKDFAHMKRIRTPYEHREAKKHQKRGRMVDFFLPLAVLIGALFLSLYLTGSGNIMKGSGSKSVFIAVVTSLFSMYVLYVCLGEMKEKLYFKLLWQGMFDLAPIVALLWFAFAFSGSMTELGTARYLGGLFSEHISTLFIPALIFLLSSVIAFATGTSWGTFAIMMPIALASIDSNLLNPALVVGAVVSGGVFGDHTSPISDTTILSSLAAECEPINHVKTQLPYALFSASVALLLFIIFTFFSIKL